MELQNTSGFQTIVIISEHLQESSFKLHFFKSQELWKICFLNLKKQSNRKSAVIFETKMKTPISGGTVPMIKAGKLAHFFIEQL